MFYILKQITLVLYKQWKGREKGKMESKIEIIPKQRIAFMRRTGPYGRENRQVMERLKKWATEKSLLSSATIFAIPQDNPAITSPKKCRFDVGITLSEEYLLQEDRAIREGWISGGKYVVYNINHTAKDIAKAYKAIFPDLNKHGYQITNKPIMERYTGDMYNHPYCDICVPVK